MEEIDFTKIHPLNSTWVYWYHDFSDDFSENKFIKAIEFSTIEDFTAAFNNIYPIDTGMYFMMRKGISPCWEEQKNSHLWWLRKKISSEYEAKCIWLSLARYIVGETLFKGDDACYSPFINGISISPKDNSYVFKIWTNGDYGDKQMEIINVREYIGNIEKIKYKLNFAKDAKYLFNNQKSGQFQYKKKHK
uniref:Eukaryotic translation initiation factor 4E n=1 Tax=viral metagenome TaxID=1070528 RepID=A0A6C0J2I0_9ZZZZ